MRWLMSSAQATIDDTIKVLEHVIPAGLAVLER
jgi:hypothetical protein